MKKTLALLLAVVMVASLFAGCGNNNAPAQNTAPAATATEPAASESVAEAKEAAVGTYSVDYATNTVNAGSCTTAVGSAEGGQVRTDVYAGIEGKDYTDPEHYTKRDSTAGTTNLNWGPLTWETNEDSYLLDYTTSGFYAFALNSDKTGFAVVPELAAEMPVDVTADYVGQYGIKEGDTAKAWKIALNPDACWDNGEKINADTYMYSYKELLDPLMKNRRADSLYAGEFSIVGAKAYFYQGQSAANNNTAAKAELTLGADGVYTLADGTPLYLDLNNTTSPNNSGYSLNDLAGMGYVTDEVIKGLTALEVNGKIPYTDEARALLLQFTGSDDWGNEPEETLETYAFYDVTYPEVGFDTVGIIKTGEYELVQITENPTENASYYVPYNLGGSYLVYEPLWESCKTYFDSNGNTVTADSANVASITTNYCTSLETSISYGPYKLTYFELDKQMTFDRNENWYGYHDGKHLGQYQTDTISCQVIPQQATELMAFLKGELDSASLTAEDMATYGTSDYIRYIPQSYTTKITFNSDLNKLSERGNAVLANPNFRKAFSLAIDRNTFASSYTSAGQPGFGLLNYMYIYDPFTGATYRDTDGAMDALVQLYGLTYGDDGDFDSLEEAYDAITGYDLEAAQALMAQAYDECVANGTYDGTSNVTLELSVYQSDDIYVKMFNYLKDALVSACKGTGFEGKIDMKMTADADYYETMYSGNTDMIFTTWGGAASQPYSMLDQVYCDASDGSGNQNEYGFDTSKVMVEIEVDGEKYVDSLKNWAAWAGAKDTQIKGENGTVLAPFGSYDATTRSAMFSKLEYAYLSFYATTPLYYRNSGVLYSQKISFPVDQYIDLITFGETRFMTYNYTDAEWDAYAAAGLSY